MTKQLIRLGQDAGYFVKNSSGPSNTANQHDIEIVSRDKEMFPKSIVNS